MNGGNGRNLEMYSRCTLLAITVLYLYANTLPILVSGESKQQSEHPNQRFHQGEEIPLVRLPSNTLLKYTAYKDVSILHFDIPSDTRTALFNFKAYEETKSAFQRHCEPRDVTLHLKAGSYPVISPENITFPKHFLHADQRFEIYNLQFKSDGKTRRLSIDGPQIGDWFAVAFIAWTDPNNDRIEQQGLAASCETLLLSEMSVVRTTAIILNGGNGITHNNTLHGTVVNHTVQSAGDANNNSSSSSDSSTANKSQAPSHESINYKMFVPHYVDVVTLRFNVWTVCTECPDVSLNVQANALPTPKSFIQAFIIYANKTGETLLEFYPQQNAWHYVEIKFAGGNNSSTVANSSTSTVPFDGFEARPAPTTTSPPIKSPGKLSKFKSKLDKKPPLGDAKYAINFTISFDFTDEKTPSEIMQENENKSMSSTHNGTMDADTESSADTMMQSTLSSDWLEVSDDVDMIDETASKLFAPARNINYYSLLRQTYREFFMFDYDLLPDDNGTVPTFINLTAGIPTGFRFEVGSVYDIGGTLSFAVVMKDNLKDLSIGAVASASIVRGRKHISDAVAEKLVQVAGEESGPGNSGTGIDNMNYEVDHLNVNDDSHNENGDDDNSVGRSNQTIIICMHLGEPGIPTWPDKCVYGRHILPAASIVNNTNDETSTGLIHVPFPEPGTWYVTLGLYCHGAETAARTTIIDSVKDFIKKYVDLLIDMRPPCACANGTARYRECIGDHRCLSGMTESETLKVKECLMDSKCTPKHQEMARKFELHHKFATEQSVATGSSCNASAVFTISSSPCVAGRCGRYGRCYHYMSGGFVFSTCLCIKGYRGWDCTEESQVPSSFSILMAQLFLTLSNLLFIPSIYIAVRRKYFTEGLIYFFAMFFSIFYHACDSGEDEYSFCLVKISVLQFCDFYSGLMSIWLTLVCLIGPLRPEIRSLLHMFGAIVLAFGTELNKQSLWVFLAPALTGLCLISVSWGWRCHRTHKCFPARKYLTVYLPIGMVLVMIGLICYAFLQTRQNYHIVHSIWHMVMALSILCLLPNRKTFLPKC